jgi:hypothetical protein
VEYLERYPARPDYRVLRRLAAALQTSPAALLGGGSAAAPGAGHGMPCPVGRPEAGPPGSPARRLTAEQCWRLIEPGGVGRVGFSTPSGPVILPVNYVVASGGIVFRVGRGTLLEEHAQDRVAFEVDHIDDALCQGWSVLVSGDAHAVLAPGELRRLRGVADPHPWPAGDHDIWVRIVPCRITGRHVEAQ